jgi:hypothetical protein
MTFHDFLLPTRVKIYSGFAGLQDYPASYIRFYEGMKYPRIPAKKGHHF